MAKKKKPTKNKPKAAKKSKPKAKKVKKAAKPKKAAKVKKVKKVKKAVKKVAKAKKVQKVKKVKKAAAKKVSKKVAKKSKAIKPVKTQKSKYGRYSDKELTEFRILIKDKLEFSRKEMKDLQEQITRKDGHGTDDTENRFVNMEDGTSTMEREYLNQMAARTHQYIDHLEKALQRIENKTYGICRVTGKLIPKERLRAVPHATLSIEAKQMMQKQQPQQPIAEPSYEPQEKQEQGEEA